MQKKREKV
ncbi:unnamed protein product [Cuscuta europaea]|uniref:Uncharacterized protein n=1 Tax=Cuscuta europaea TaxID=41803 RepID=A0A9P0ZEI0_CUSEU|nr:unnamed protein product [Cuscuta europaea]